ncbi:MAG: type I methionyl aminopeptidase [Candidatus Marinimicrobia bacterium CG08_land_8_20_14_0_20_45_22]|nr:MAG: type I methionyl aminopeptidase [Candidatus Marinimicrobia bacterium CG08_land_8_20_14_0_20_45_22]
MIYIRSQEEIGKMRESNRIVAETIHILGLEIKPGIQTGKLDKIADEYIRSRGTNPAFKGYRGYPASICISIDEEVVHGIPSKRELRAGQIVSVDVGAEKDGYYGDSAYTFAVGEVSETKKHLMQVTKDSLYKGIEKALPGKHLSDIGNAVQSYVEMNGFSVVRDMVGHGIGQRLHESPEVPNYGDPGKGPILRPGMCLAIEPMVNAGTFEVYVLDNGWTIVTADHQPSAHYEHTIAITETGPVILSVSE